MQKVDEQTGRQLDGQKFRRQIDRWVDGQLGRNVEGRQIDGQIIRWVDNQMGRNVEGRQIDGQIVIWVEFKKVARIRILIAYLLNSPHQIRW